MRVRSTPSTLALTVFLGCLFLLPTLGEAVSFRKLVDTSTPIPDGVGNFSGGTPFTPPSISLGTVLFGGMGSSGQLGIYKVIGGMLSVVADKNTPVPGGTGNFTDFRFSVVSIFGGDVVFTGTDSANKVGIYRLPAGGVLEVVADTNTPVPGGPGNFTNFGFIRVETSDGNVAFTGFSSGKHGIYIKIGAAVSLIASTDTIAPLGGGAKFTFTNAPTLSGANVAFRGGYSGVFGPTGIYKSIGGVLSAVADTNTLAPGGVGTFTSFFTPSISGEGVALLGVSPVAGIYTDAPGVLVVLADTNTPAPGGGGGTFSVSDAPTISGGKVVFSGAVSGATGFIPGLYIANIGGTLDKLIDRNGILDSTKTISSFQTTDDALSGN